MKKKKFMVIPREKSTVINGIDTGLGHIDFNGKSSAYIDDPAQAREIDQRYGNKGTKELYIAEDEQYSRAVNGESWDVKGDNVKTLHHWTFSGVDTSHFGKVKAGDQKTINGTLYKYVANNGKLSLEPVPQKRNKRREVKHDNAI